jgi:HTH-type transcriptional regulator/antitoxin HigA
VPDEKSSEKIRRVSPKAKVLNRDRARFEVAGGNYRLIASFDFRRQSVRQVYRHACRIRRHRSADCCQILMRTTMQIRPIRSSKNHRAALAEIEKLWGASTGTPEGDKLDILVTLVETYEERRWPLRSRRRFDPVDVLRYAIEELGHSQAELADILGSRSRASEVLARRRPLTLEMIQKIHASWKIPADLLVQPYRIDATAA